MSIEKKSLAIPRRLPRIERFEKMAYGMFIHWGLYSVLGQCDWAMFEHKIPVDEYAKLKDSFTADEFDARSIARLAKEAGMKYITLTTRHHEGFSLYDTRGLSDFDAVHSPAGRDLIAEFVEGCKAEGIVPFLYHTTVDWRLGSHTCSEEEFEKYLDYLHASVEVLCRNYGEIGGFWFDGDWSRPDSDWKLGRLYGLIRKYQSETMIINNTGLHKGGEVVHEEIDSVTFEQSLPKKIDLAGHKKYFTGEMCETMNTHWGFAGDDYSYKSPVDLITSLSKSRKVGANYLLNVGPTAGGRIPELETEILKKVGKWVNVYGDAVYNGRPVDATCVGDDFILEANGKWYYFVFDLCIAGHENVTVEKGWSGPRAINGIGRKIKKVKWMDNGDVLDFAQSGGNDFAVINLVGYPLGSQRVVRVAEIEYV
jgi:alpha-L-fucosidase